MPKVELFARTEVGCARERNEDTFFVLDLQGAVRSLQPDQRVRSLTPPGTVVAVCDGMGGAAAGDVASQLAVDALEEVARRYAPFTSEERAAACLQEAVGSANRAILQYAQQDPGRHGMGTTMTAAVLFGPSAVIAHVGDSRAYIRRGRLLQQVTRDQSVVGQMLASGQLTPEQARTYDQRNVLLQALGVETVVRPEIVSVDVRAGDVLLLCTDGLNGPMSDGAILELMLKHEDPMRCCRALTEAACAAGGPDNITVLVARFTGEDLPIPAIREPVNVRQRQRFG